jgi:hypothetical protein
MVEEEMWAREKMCSWGDGVKRRHSPRKRWAQRRNGVGERMWVKENTFPGENTCVFREMEPKKRCFQGRRWAQGGDGAKKRMCIKEKMFSEEKMCP